MKKIKFLLIAMMAMMTTTAFVACSDDDDDKVSNMERYQNEVDNVVKAQKKNSKAILLVAFGSTWQQAYDAFDLTRSEYEKEFSGYDVYLSFSSAICINRAMAAENTDARSFYEPRYWLEAFGRVQYSEIIVQSMQVIPGEEFSRVVNAMKDFGNNSNGDLDDKYMSQVTLKLGMPLMYTQADAATLASALNANFSKYAQRGAMCFMGHGNPDEYDTYKANVRYTQLEEALQLINPNYFVGTVDMADNYKVQVRDRMIAAGLTSGNVYCAPLMSIAGDHAHNDMADEEMIPEGAKSFSDLEENEDGEVEDCSWRAYFDMAGYNIDEASFKDNGADALVKGLLEYQNIRALYKNHTRNAEVVDFYHSMYPEE
ncbi:MAG: sirohydrochlorin cobaltochelatase [Prevotella sp.]|nr:sirohydrochlorin cobaltochelatase [Prevotella sp.]